MHIEHVLMHMQQLLTKLCDSEHLNFYVVSVPWEIKYSSKCITCSGLTNSGVTTLKTNGNNGEQIDRWSLMEEVYTSK